MVDVVAAEASAAALGPQGQMLTPTITNLVCGSRHISAGFLMMPPARVAKPHLHKDNELIIFFIEGWGVAFVGREFEPHYVAPGDFLYVPAGVIHFGINLSETERSTAIEIRTDPYFNKDVQVIPEMVEESLKIAADYRQRFANGTLDVPESWKSRSRGPYSYPS